MYFNMQRAYVSSLQRDEQNWIPLLVIVATKAWRGSLVTSENPPFPLGGVIYLFPRVPTIQACEPNLGSQAIAIQIFQGF